MNLQKAFLYCLSFSLVFAQPTAFGFVANNSNLNKVEYNTELNKYKSHENYVKYSHTASVLIVKNEQIHCAIPIHEELQREIELNLAKIQKQNKTEFPVDTQIADNEQIQSLTVCPPELAQELLDQGYREMQYGMSPLNVAVYFTACFGADYATTKRSKVIPSIKEEDFFNGLSRIFIGMACLPIYVGTTLFRWSVSGGQDN